MDYITLGPTPPDEDCSQVGSENYSAESTKECKRFAILLLRAFPPPLNAHMRVRIFPHDFGSYREVVVCYDENDQASSEYAFNLDQSIPSTWGELEALANKISPTF